MAATKISLSKTEVSSSLPSDFLYITGSPGLKPVGPHCRFGLPSLHKHTSPFLIIHMHTYTHPYVLLVSVLQKILYIQGLPLGRHSLATSSLVCAQEESLRDSRPLLIRACPTFLPTMVFFSKSCCFRDTRICLEQDIARQTLLSLTYLIPKKRKRPESSSYSAPRLKAHT